MLFSKQNFSGAPKLQISLFLLPQYIYFYSLILLKAGVKKNKMFVVLLGRDMASFTLVIKLA